MKLRGKKMRKREKSEEEKNKNKENFFLTYPHAPS